MTKSYRIGKTNTNTNGQNMTIIAYHDVNNIDIKFDDGAIICDRTYTAFCDGHIKHPNKITKALIDDISPSKRAKTNRINETITANNGQNITIIAYRNRFDIDVQFEDKTIIKHRSYKSKF